MNSQTLNAKNYINSKIGTLSMFEVYFNIIYLKE